MYSIMVAHIYDFRQDVEKKAVEIQPWKAIWSVLVREAIWKFAVYLTEMHLCY